MNSNNQTKTRLYQTTTSEHTSRVSPFIIEGYNRNKPLILKLPQVEFII